MDRRLTPATPRVAHQSLRGRMEAARFVPGEPAAVAVALADLLAAPGGARDRQVLLGQPLTVIERHEGFAFVQAGRDGYCGWLPEAAVGPPVAATHWVASTGTHLYAGPKVQTRALASLSLGARLEVTGRAGDWAETPAGFVPWRHLLPLDARAPDPVAVAEGFLGVPYLWGGNGRDGLDCSGLVQGALMACGIACAGDSDLQAGLGTAVPPGADAARGDLVFWKGHVGLMRDAETLLHANGHHMAVAAEPLAAAVARIAAAGGGPVTAHRRPPAALSGPDAPGP